MPVPHKIDAFELAQQIAEGKTDSQIASYFKVSNQAVWTRRKKLEAKAKIRGETIISSRQTPGSLIPSGRIDTSKQLNDINTRANRLMREAMEKASSNPTLAGKMMAEIRHQLELQLRIYQALYDVQAVEEFQRVVLEEIDACTCPACGASTALTQAIIKRLKESRSRRSALRM